MTFFDKIGHYVRIASGMHQYLRTPMPNDWDALTRRQLEQREKRWVKALARAVFARRDHPYHQMFRLAGCSYEDLVEAVGREGLEPTLARLRSEGVYLTHDEFKGKKPIVRSGRHIPSDANSFANPLAEGWLETTSGGSRSKGTKIRTSTAHRIHCEAYYALNIREFGLQERAQIQVKPILPAGAGIGCCVSYTRLGCRVERWFATGGSLQDSAHYRAVTNYLVALARLHGTKAPFPTHLPPNDFTPVAGWIAERKRQGISCAVGSYTSPAVRVAAAALEHGLDISGTLFLVSGEALTGAKREVVESAGCQLFSRYHIAEVGPVGYGCRQMTRGNCVHLFRDSLAVVNYRRLAPLSDVEVDSLLFTNLLPSAPNLLINADMDDCGIVEEARCDCVYHAAGFTEQIRDIHSIGKLTGQGMTLVGTDVVRVLEEVLPAKFGGAATDYQLIEQEGGAQTQLVLRVSPRARVSSLEEVQRQFLHEIRRCYGGALAARVWEHAGALTVVCAEPVVTGSGKVLPLHLMGGRGESTHAS